MASSLEDQHICVYRILYIVYCIFRICIYLYKTLYAYIYIYTYCSNPGSMSGSNLVDAELAGGGPAVLTLFLILYHSHDADKISRIANNTERSNVSCDTYLHEPFSTLFNASSCHVDVSDGFPWHPVLKIKWNI